MDKHRDLIAWQKCRELVRVLYVITGEFPPCERYGLASQIRRAAVSTMANIAEGYARYGRAEFAHSLSIVLGSLAEIDALLQVAEDAGYVTAEEHARIEAIRAEASRVTYGLQRGIRR